MTEEEKLKKRMSRDNAYNTFGNTEFINANTGKEVRLVTENWSTFKAKCGVTFNGAAPIDEDYLNSKQVKYLNKLPPYLMLGYLTDEQLDNDDELIRLFKIPADKITANMHLAKLSEETLEFLLKRYN